MAGMLATFGYVANTAQSDDAVQSIVGLMTWLPALMVLPLIGFALMHRLDEKNHRHIVHELKQRSTAPSASDSADLPPAS